MSVDEKPVNCTVDAMKMILYTSQSTSAGLTAWSGAALVG